MHAGPEPGSSRQATAHEPAAASAPSGTCAIEQPKEVWAIMLPGAILGYDLVASSHAFARTQS